MTANPHFPGRRIGEEFNVLHALPQLVEDDGTAFEQRSTVDRRLGAMTVAFKQAHAEHMFVYKVHFPNGRTRDEKWTGNAGFWTESIDNYQRIYHCSSGCDDPPNFESLVFRLTIVPLEHPKVDSNATQIRFVPQVEEVLKDSGWFEGRNTEGSLRLPEGFEMFPAASRVLAEFGDLCSTAVVKAKEWAKIGENGSD